MALLRTEELVYPNLPLEDVDRFLEPEYDIVIFDQQPQKVEEERHNLPLSANDEFIPNANPELKRLDSRRTAAVGMVSRIVMPEVITDAEPDVVAYPARIIITKPGILGRLIAKMKNEEPMAKVDAAIIIGKKDHRQTNG